MIRSIDIPKENWINFLQMLNRDALGRSVRLEVAREELGDQELAAFMPLRRIDFETKGSELGSLLVSVGQDWEELTHRIDAPSYLCIGHNGGGEIEWLAIEDAREGLTLIHFQYLPALVAEISGPHLHLS
jgi:hypothetical protein